MVDAGQPPPDQEVKAGDPASEVVAHLQAAALEVIAAFRAFLDAAEDVVRDPAGALAVAATLASRGRGRRGEDGEGEGDDGRVQRIPVS
jgi:hypothetical protein